MKTTYLLIVLFTQTNEVQEFPFASLKECEQIKPAIVQLYEGLRQPVSLRCKPVKESKPSKSLSKVSFTF